MDFLQGFSQGMNRRLSSHDAVVLRFMEKTIENVNTLLAGQYTLFKFMIEKGIISEKDLISKLKEDRSIPNRKMGIQTLKEMLSPNWEEKIDFDGTEKQLLTQACDRITTIKLPPSWIEEGVEAPNSTAVRNALRICHEIYNTKKMIPDITAPTKECGIFFRYDLGSRNLVVEAYNDGRIAAVVGDNAKKEVIYSEDISEYNFEKCLEILTVNK